jgi:hypothetical protein
MEECGHCLTIPSSRVHPIHSIEAGSVVSGDAQSLAGGASRASKTPYMLTRSDGSSVLDANGKPRVFYAEKPSMAAQKAFYSWRRAHADWIQSSSPLRVSADVRAWIASLSGVTVDHLARFVNRLEELNRNEISTGVELYIAKEGQRAPRRYVCYQRLNTRPNAHQVRKLIVMESRAALCASGLPAEAALTKLLTPFS